MSHRLGLHIGLADRVVIVSGGAHDLRAVTLNRFAAPFAHGGVDVDHTLTTK